MGAQRPAELERRSRDAASDAPDQDPFVRPQGSLRDEHPIGRLEDQREGRALLERERIVELEHLVGGDRDQLAMGAVTVLSDDRDGARRARSLD